MSQVHDGILLKLIDRIGVQSFREVIGVSGRVTESNLFFSVTFPVRDQFIKIAVCIIDDERGGAGKVLVRSGIRQLTIVDSDRVCITNINRQLMATTKTVGQVKVDALKERLLSINPKAEITALQKIFSEETADSFQLDTYDYIIDAIDSLKDKAALILLACKTKAKLFSSMGAALKLDPTRIKVTEFWKVQGDPLARALRKKFKSQKQFPKRKFQCVYSDELLENRGHNATCGTEQCMCPKAQNGPGDQSLLNHEWCSSKAQINGTLAHITAIFGFMLAGLVVQDATM
jgi:tRNA A37 threonylcarbamoyladenosine dehydratase